MKTSALYLSPFPPPPPPPHQELQSFVSIIQDSWETDVLARLTASCIEARLKTFRSCHAPRPASSQSKDSGLAESRQSPLGTVTPRSGHASSCSTHCGEARLQPSLSVSGSITSPGGRKPPCGHYFCRPRCLGACSPTTSRAPCARVPLRCAGGGRGKGVASWQQAPWGPSSAMTTDSPILVASRRPLCRGMRR